MGEFALIERIAARTGRRDDVLLGIGDDAALLAPPPGQVLVVATDTLNAGVHFPEATDAASIGHKALAVNLSDLAAMGAMPLWFTLSLSLPSIDPDWCEALLDGLFALADDSGIALVGGDTTRGPLSLGVTALGAVPPATALRRDGARAGDAVLVTGTLGDAAAALVGLQRSDAVDAALRLRLDRPTPRLSAGLALRGRASACIDLSDGLLADLGHVARASGVGAEIEASRLPASAAFEAAVPAADRAALQLTGGDDYELCFTVPESGVEAVKSALSALGIVALRIGRIVAGDGVRVRDAAGRELGFGRAGHEHFGAGE